MTKPFAKGRRDFAPDGALRDFYIAETSSPEWARFLAVIPTLSKRVTFTWGDNEVALPDSFEKIAQMQEQDRTLLTVQVSGRTVCCHFFVASEIELDFWPDDFQDEQQSTELVQFFQLLVDAIGKRGIITHENSQDSIIAEITPKGLPNQLLQATS